MSPAHRAHNNNNGQVPWDTLDDESLQIEDHTGKQHHQHLPHHHRGHACCPVPARISTSAALHVSSDQSTPSRARSPASSTFTPLSGLPSSPSRPYAAADAKGDADADADRDADRDADDDAADGAYAAYIAEAVRGNASLSGVEGLSSCCAPEPKQQPSRPPSPGLLASPVWHPQTPNADADADYDAGNAADVESLSAHALSLDQTRLRIAYLVSTMVTPLGEGRGGRLPVVEPHTPAPDLVVPARLVTVSATVGAEQPQGGVFRSLHQVAVDNVVGAAIAPRNQGLTETARRTMPPVHPLPALIHWFNRNCPAAWTSVDPAKKQQKIYTASMWQAEVAALDDATYCACSKGAPSLHSGGDTTHPPPAVLHRVLSASNPDKAVDDSKNEPPEQPEQPEQPEPLEQPEELEQIEQSEQPDAAADGASVATKMTTNPDATPEICPACGHPLPPQRPVVWVPGGGWSARAQETASGTIRRALKSIRGLVTKKKKRPALNLETYQDPEDAIKANKASKTSKASKGAKEAKETRGSAVPIGRNVPEQSAQQQQQKKKKKQGGDHATETTGPWDQWDQLNCENLLAEDPANADLFFPRTAVYRDVAHAVATEDDESDWTPSVDDEDAEAREKRRQHETGRRLRRAQRLLLAQTNATKGPAVENADPAATPKETTVDEPSNVVPPRGACAM